MELEFVASERFEITARLGEGAMGVVYRAHDREKNEAVAIKTLRDLNADGLLRFKNEFRSIQNLQHPNLISLGELFEVNGRWFFSMELVEGTDFFSWVRPHRRKDDLSATSLSGDFSTSATAKTVPAWMSDVGAPPGFDEQRLRAAIAQLAQGISALHRAGFVHRDIKPSNVLVSREGRVVLLDFGFVAATRDHSSDRIVGTAAYMSPEQAASRPVAPESDWYAVGVMLYEALTGRPPFEGTPIEVLMGKQHRTPEVPSKLVAGLPMDLEELCLELLRISPEDRPRESEILRRLGAASMPASSSASLDLSASIFVGRERELAALDECFQECREGKTVSVFVHGESGIGKSALVRAFLERVEARAIQTLILASQCYERESVPYKAFDGVVDALSRHLAEVPAVDVAMVVPFHVTPVTQVFPVLRRSEVIARAVRPLVATLEPAELRARMFAGLREMFARLASTKPVVVVIDDFQWADADSLALLRELVRGPDAPPLLLVATVRSGVARPEAAAPTAGHLNTMYTRDIQLTGLNRRDAQDLAGKLARHIAPGLIGLVEAVVGDSQGHPLYIDEMLRHGALAGAAPTAPLQLETVLWHRIIGLETPARDVLELTSLSAGPLATGVAAAAARLSFADFSRWVSMLRVAKLVQTTGARRADTIEIFHDRVRQAVLHHMTPLERRRCHERLALAMESSGTVAAESLGLHWQGAGEHERALQYIRLAAKEAEQALAFERAARLYRHCIELLPPDSTELAELRELVGHALANAGLGAEAANAYMAAAEISRHREVELYAVAAGQLLRSGHVDSALEVLRRSLAPLRLRLPPTPFRAMVSLALQRAQMYVRGLRFRERKESEITRRALTRIDVSWSLAAGFSLIDFVRGAEFQARHLRMALSTGEPHRIARALSIEVAFRFSAGTRGGDAAREVLSLSEALAARLGNPPNLIGQNTLMAGIGAFLEGRFAAAEVLCAEAETILRDRCSGVGWELSSARILHLWALWYLGKVTAMRTRLPTVLREATERGDLYAATSFRSYFEPMLHLCDDDPDRAEAIATQALTRWSQRGFHVQHYSRLFAVTQARLYAGAVESALELVESSWKELKGSQLLSVQQMRIEALHFRGRAELAVGRARRDEKLLDKALARAKKIRRERALWGDGLAALLVAGVAMTRGDHMDARRLLEEALDLAERRDMALYAAAARRALGEIRGAEGGALIAAADAAFATLGVAAPARMARMLAPGFDDGERAVTRERAATTPAGDSRAAASVLADGGANALPA